MSGSGGEPGSSNQALRRRAALVPYPEDATLIDAAAQATKANLAARHPWDQLRTLSQISCAAYYLRKFSDWLRREHKEAIAGRLDDDSVNEDCATFRRAHPKRSPSAGLRMLRSHAGTPGSSARPPLRRSALVCYPQDAALIDAAAQAAKANIAAGRPWEQLGRRKLASNAAHELRQFSNWLRREHKSAIAGRIGEASLQQDSILFSRAYPRSSLSVGFMMLQKHRGEPMPSGQTQRRRTRPVPYPEDEALINAAAEVAKANIDAGTPWPFVGTRRRVNQAVKHLKEFSGWLKTMSKRAIADRLDDASLKEDITTFYNAERRYSVDSGVRMLREHAKDLEEFAAGLEQQLEIVEAPSAAGEGTYQHGPLKSVFAQLFGESPPRESPPSSPGLRSGGSDRNAATSRMVRDDAIDAPMPDIPEQLLSARSGGSHSREDAHHSSLQPLFTQLFGESPPPSESPQWSPGLRGGSDLNGAMSPTTRDAVAREDFGQIVGLGWSHGPQAAPDVLIGALNRRSILPTPLQPMINFYICGQPYTAQLGRGIREVSPNNPLGVSITLIPLLKGG
ncbi:hypothetical protein [Bradyrhizobium genosp. P]|uniref:hypothetical protein n=1 Tax=Bradyrhizobium genosp. P TaxID=83641 RepID=UPI003CECF0E9